MSIGPDERQGWVERPWAARSVGAVAYIIPFAASVLSAFALSTLLPIAPNLFIGMLRWLGVAIASTVVLLVVERQTRRLMPLRTLLGLTLAFPDKAPSRFKIAIRTGTTNQLRERLDEAQRGRLGDTPSEAAERLLELVGMLSHHDRLTRGHSERVRAYSHMIGEEMGLSGKELDRLRWAGLLHDVGKLAISPAILNKPGKLTAEEFDIVKTHPMEGKALVQPLAGWLGEAARAVWEHHERWDGGGYPQGLAGTEISEAARIVSVADVFDVITSIRSYKSATSAREARAEIARCAGTQFDPDVVRAFLALSVGKVRRTLGPLSWVAQIAFLPGAVAAHAGPALAAAAVVTAGATAGTMGIVADPGPAVAHREEFVASVAPVRAPLEAPPDTVIAEPTGAAPAPDAATTSTTIEAVSASVEPEGTPTPQQPDPPVSVTTATTSPPVADPDPVTTTTTSTTTTTTSSTTTTSTTTTTTTTTVPPPDGEELSLLYLLPAGSGDQASQSPLSFGTDRPADGPLFNYDTDRNDAPGMLLAKDSLGVHSTDPTKVQRFRTASLGNQSHTTEATLLFDVAAKDFGDKDVRVQAQVLKCSAAGPCVSLAIGDKTVRNASRFKRVNVDLGLIDLQLNPADRLEVRIAILDDSEDDAWIAFGTRTYDGRLIVEAID